MSLSRTQHNRSFWKAPRTKILFYYFSPSYKLIKFCRDGDHSLPPSTSMKRRAQALIFFVGYALKPEGCPSSEGESISAVIARLTTLATLTGGNIDEISEAARSSIHRLLSGMSVANFIESVESSLKSGDAKVNCIPLQGSYNSSFGDDLRFKQVLWSCLAANCPMLL